MEIQLRIILGYLFSQLKANKRVDLKNINNVVPFVIRYFTSMKAIIVERCPQHRGNVKLPKMYFT